VRVFVADDGGEHSKAWQEFVESHVQASNYHRWGWKTVIENSFHWPGYYLVAEEEGKIKGVLPLVWQKSWMFGSFLTSLPFVNAGGVLAESKAAETALIHEAIALAQKLKVDYLELRHRQDHQLGLPTKTNKVAIVLAAEPDEDKMLKSLRHEVRTKIRKATKCGLTAEFAGEAVLDDFYSVFAANMRDLGTPVYGQNFFREILRAFPDDTHIIVVRHEGKPAAVSLMTAYRDTLETLWGSSLREYLSLAPNMFMYWKMLRFAAERGFRIFDFGRSTVGSGPHRFKLQWSSQEVPLHWNYWLPEGNSLPELNPQNPRYRLAIWLWQRLPLPITKWVGPGIVRCLP